MENQEPTANAETPDDRKPEGFGSEGFLTKLEAKIQENQNIQGELVKSKFDTLKTDIHEYFTKITEKIVKQLEATRETVLNKVEAIIEKETGFVDWERFREQLIQKREDYTKVQDVLQQKKAFDDYFSFYNTTMKRIDTINTTSYTKIDTASKLFKFDEIVLQSFMVNFSSLCAILESDFVTNVSFTSNHLDPASVRLEEMVQIPHEGVSGAIEKIDQIGTFVLGSRDGKLSMFDSKTLRVLDVTQISKTPVTTILYIPKESLLFAGGVDTKITVRRIDGRNLGKHLSLLDAQGAVTTIVNIEDEDLVASIGADPNIRLYHTQTLVTVGKIPTRKGFAPKEGSLYFRDKKLLMIGYNDGMFQFFNMKQRQLAFGVFMESKPFFGLTYSELSGRLLLHVEPGVVRVWNFAGERPIQEYDINLEGEGDIPCNIRTVDKYLISASNNEKVIIYDIDQRKIVKRVEVPNFRVQGILALEKDGRIIATDENSTKIAALKLH